MLYVSSSDWEKFTNSSLHPENLENLDITRTIYSNSEMSDEFLSYINPKLIEFDITWNLYI